MDPGRVSTYPMIDVPAALSLISSRTPALSPETVDLPTALHRIAAEDIPSPEDVPQCATSTMDGYAVRAGDTPAELRFAGAARAGDAGGELQQGCCMWVTTGAPIPAGADAVCPVEQCSKGASDSVSVPQCTVGKWVRAPASDIRAGEVLVRKGDSLSAAELALLASVGVATVSVARKAKVGVLSTGNELVELGEVRKSAGQVRDSNRLLLKSLLGDNGAEVIDYGIRRDDRSELLQTLTQMSQECDLLITSGGVSMGDLDLVKPLVAEHGEVVFGRVNLKPGKPTTFGFINNKPIFALPGNPVSCYVTFYVFVCAWLQQAMHQSAFPVISVHLSAKVKLDRERPEYHRARVAWDGTQFTAVSTGEQASSRLLSTAGANCLLQLPRASDSEFSADKVSGILIRPLVQMTPDMVPAPVHTHSASCKCHSHATDSKLSTLRVGILTVSDRASAGVYQDESGKALKSLASGKWPQAEVVGEVVPDEMAEIRRVVEAWCAQGVNLVLTTGGTGFTSRDITPEAVEPLLERRCPGLVIRMMTASLEVTPLAVLSRPVAGIRSRSLIITLPGSVKGASENFTSLLPALNHALTQLQR